MGKDFFMEGFFDRGGAEEDWDEVFVVWSGLQSSLPFIVFLGRRQKACAFLAFQICENLGQFFSARDVNERNPAFRIQRQMFF